MPSAAAAVARDGDTVLIDPGTYAGDVATWTQDDLTLRGDGGRAHLRADGADAQGKAIWVIAGDRTTVDRIELSGASVRDRNGAGIRQEGTDLTGHELKSRAARNTIVGNRISDGDATASDSIDLPNARLPARGGILGPTGRTRVLGPGRLTSSGSC